MNIDDYFENFAAIDDFDDEIDEFGKATIKIGNDTFLCPLNPKKLADPVLLKELLDLLTYIQVFQVADNILNYLYNCGFSNAHAQALFEAHMCYMDQLKKRATGEISEYTDEYIINLILNIEVDQELEEEMKNY